MYWDFSNPVRDVLLSWLLEGMENTVNPASYIHCYLFWWEHQIITVILTKLVSTMTIFVPFSTWSLAWHIKIAFVAPSSYRFLPLGLLSQHGNPDTSISGSSRSKRSQDCPHVKHGSSDLKLASLIAWSFWMKLHVESKVWSGRMSNRLACTHGRLWGKPIVEVTHPWLSEINCWHCGSISSLWQKKHPLVTHISMIKREQVRPNITARIPSKLRQTRSTELNARTLGETAHGNH